MQLNIDEPKLWRFLFPVQALPILSCVKFLSNDWRLGQSGCAGCRIPNPAESGQDPALFLTWLIQNVDFFMLLYFVPCLSAGVLVSEVARNTTLEIRQREIRQSKYGKDKYDKEKYDKQKYDKQRYDKEKYDKEKYDKEKYNKEKYDKEKYNKEKWDKY